MGKQIKTKLFILCLLLLIATVTVYWPAAPHKTTKKADLWQYLNHVDGYSTLGKIEMEDGHVKMLKVDDYVFADYAGLLGKVNVFIGYYYTADKVYAAHSPLICYPSQGWKIEKPPIRSSLRIGDYDVNYEEVVTSLGENRELVVYWLQTHTFTNTRPYRNKIDLAITKLKYNHEQHAFVRVATQLENNNYEQAKKRAVEFIKKFYPLFIEFIDAD